MNKYTFTTHAKSTDAILFGQMICELDWLYLGQDIELYDNNLKKTYSFGLYQVSIDDEYYSFAACEIADEEWLFYTIK
ncbi:MAG TPA: hypothetical protein GX703_00805 [Erysipelothrix sp.]|nr:hypothetical protein [Erysipelothrix sp.]